jgi:transcriptional regulator with XRE-family HTH domain
MDHLPTQTLFAGELRRARTALGLSQEALGQQINYSASLVAMVEQCRRMPRADFAERCDEVLQTNGLLGRIREVMLQEALLPWFREWVAIEQEATTLYSYQPLVVPGLLQTEGYARALLEGASRFTGDQLDRQVAARMERQKVFTRSQPPQFVAVLDEFVLRRAVGGARVMREQLRHLIEVGRRPLTHLHVVPSGAGAYAGLNGAFVIATSLEGDELAYLDNQLQGHIVARPADVLSLRQTWEAVRAEALPRRQSLDLIAKVAEEWT